MRRIALFLFALMLAPAPAYATAQLEGDTTFFIGEEVCKWAVEHVPESGVAYQPGVDVDGNPVAPASPATTMAEQRQQALADQLLRQMSIELTSDIATQLGIPQTLIRRKLTVGTVEMDESGKPVVNGVPLVNPDPAAWQAACEQANEKN